MNLTNSGLNIYNVVDDINQGKTEDSHLKLLVNDHSQENNSVLGPERSYDTNSVIKLPLKSSSSVMNKKIKKNNML